MKIMANKEVTQNKILEGVNDLNSITSVTLGGRGKNIILENQFGKIQVINDGTTIANEVVFEDPLKNAGATLAKQVASKTNEEAGDGTTTSIVLLHSFLKEMEKIKMKNSRGQRKEIKQEVDKVIEKLDKMKRDVKDGDIERIAYISSLDEEISKNVAELIKKIGKDGVINIEESKSVGITTEVVSGVRVDKGYITQLMATDNTTLKAEIIDTPVLVTRKKLNVVSEILPLMQFLSSQKQNRLVIFCEDISDEVLTLLILNKVQGQFLSLVVKTSDLDDISTVTGAKVISEQNNLEFEADNLGVAGKVVATRFHTTVMDGKVDKSIIDDKVSELKKLQENEEIPYEKERLAKRIARLIGGVSVIKIGGENEVETFEKKLKLEDAVNAVKAAMEDGVVEGGGVALYKISLDMAQEYGNRDLTDAEKLVNVVITKPFYQVLENAELDLYELNDVCIEIQNSGRGFNVITEKFENFFESGVIDPVKVTKCAVRNAFSMGMQILTAEASILIKKEKEK